MELKPGGDDAAPRAYARWLRRGSYVGVAVLVAGFAAYLLGMTPHERYLEYARLRPGWDWATYVHRSDMLAVAGIALLATCSVVSLAAAIRAFRASGERALMAICAAQIAVLLLAASGLLAGSH